MRPSPKGQIPAIARNSVDLPDPEGPEGAAFSPSASTRCFVSTMRLPSGEKDRHPQVDPGSAAGPRNQRWPGIAKRLRLVNTEMRHFLENTPNKCRGENATNRKTWIDLTTVWSTVPARVPLLTAREALSLQLTARFFSTSARSEFVGGARGCRGALKYLLSTKLARANKKTGEKVVTQFLRRPLAKRQRVFDSFTKMFHDNSTTA